MSAGAWIMLVSTWTVVLYFTLRFVRRVLRASRPAGQEPERDQGRR